MSWSNFLDALSAHPVTAILLGFWVIVFVFAIKSKDIK